MNSKQQQGFTLTIYLIITIVVLVTAGGGFLYLDRSRLERTIKEQQNTIGEQKATIGSLETANRTLVKENGTLAKKITLLESINNAMDVERSRRENLLKEYAAAYKALSNNLPTPLSDTQVCKMSDLELKNSDIRIRYLWDIYQLDPMKMNTKEPWVQPKIK